MDARETKIFILILILVLVIGSIIVYFFLSLLRQQKAILALKKENLVAELSSIEKERSRIAADLHDEVAPVLSAVKLKVDSFELANAADKKQQQKTNEHLTDLLRRLREISFDLMPVTLQRKGLVAALHELAGYWSNKHNLQIQITAENILLSEGFSVHLYRIVQEIVHNTIKHAGATVLQVHLKKQGQKLVLSTTDNGKGFHYQKSLQEGSGYGLRNLLSRADVLGGDLYIDTGEGSGTTYVIIIPLSAS